MLMKATVDGSDATNRLHQLVIVHGRERAREMVPERQRPLVDIAAEVMADESQRIGISYTGFALPACPTSGYPTVRPGKKRGTALRCGLNQAG